MRRNEKGASRDTGFINRRALHAVVHGLKVAIKKYAVDKGWSLWEVGSSRAVGFISCLAGRCHAPHVLSYDWLLIMRKVFDDCGTL